MIINNLISWQKNSPLLFHTINSQKITPNQCIIMKKQKSINKQERYYQNIQHQYNRLEELNQAFTLKILELQEHQDRFENYMRNHKLFLG